MSAYVRERLIMFGWNGWRTSVVDGRPSCTALPVKCTMNSVLATCRAACSVPNSGVVDVISKISWEDEGRKMSVNRLNRKILSTIHSLQQSPRQQGNKQDDTCGVGTSGEGFNKAPLLLLFSVCLKSHSPKRLLFLLPFSLFVLILISFTHVVARQDKSDTLPQCPCLIYILGSKP